MGADGAIGYNRAKLVKAEECRTCSVPNNIINRKRGIISGFI
jgi:hypothetical protein